MDFAGLFTNLTTAAKGLLPRIVPGAGPLIEAGKSIASAIDHLKTANGGRAPADATAVRDQLMAKVRKHAESTASRLEG